MAGEGCSVSVARLQSKRNRRRRANKNLNCTRQVCVPCKYNPPLFHKVHCDSFVSRPWHCNSSPTASSVTVTGLEKKTSCSGRSGNLKSTSAVDFLCWKTGQLSRRLGLDRFSESILTRLPQIGHHSKAVMSAAVSMFWLNW